MLDPRKFDELKRFNAEYQIVVKGELDAEYKRVADLIAEWDKRNNLGQQTAAIAEARMALTTDQKVFEQAKAAQDAKVTAATDSISKREAALTARIKEHNASRVELSAAQGAHASTASATTAAFNKRAAELEQKAKDLDELQNVLHQRDVKLAEREAEVRRVLNTLGTVSIR